MNKRALYRVAARALPVVIAMGLGARAEAAEPAATAEARAEALVGQMTLDEKLGQMTNTAPAIPRLGVSGYQYWNEALHGANGEQKTTNFPEPIGLAATFDDGLLMNVAGAIGAEVRDVSAANRAEGKPTTFGAGLDVWAPNLNIFRDPRWGRGQETYGEDPYLTGRMGVAYVRGIQGPDPDHPAVIATPKHFDVHSGPEPTRHLADVTVSAHDLEDTYLPAFRAAIVEGRAGSIMCAYNAVNGQPACANDFLLGTKLRGDWGFKGYVVSDCGAVEDLYQPRKYAPSAAAGAAVAVKAGMDNECSIESALGLPSAKQKYADGVTAGLLDEKAIDRALVRVFTARYRVGAVKVFQGRPAVPADAIASPEHAALALESAEKSMVLLKNDGVLPLKRPKPTIAVIGPLADAVRVLRGNYSSGRSPRPITVVEGLKRAFPAGEIIDVPAGPFVGDADLVPTSALLTPDGKPGLRAEYFPAAPSAEPKPLTLGDLVKRTASVRYAATPSVTRTEPNVSTWPLGPLGEPPSDARVTWSGYLTPPESGVYRLGLRGVVGQLTFDGKPLVQLLHFPAGGLPELKTVKLEKGRRYPITITSRKLGQLDVGLVWKRISETPEADVRAAAAKADVIVAVVGLTSDLEGEEMKVDIPGFAGGDRTSLDLPAGEQALLEAAKATGKPLVVVAMNGGALNLSWANQNADAVVEAWYPGQAGGAAVANVLSGKVNPAGRLPVTFYKSVSDLPPFTDYAMAGRTYRYFKGTPLYPFGYGLSYTRFAYGPLTLTPALGGAEKGLQVSVNLSNTGKRAGDEVAQLYLEFPQDPGAPRLALRGFQRVHLAAGEHRPVVFKLSPRDLSSVSSEGVRRVLAGQYRVSVGGGQPNTGAPAASSTFVVREPASIAK